MAANTKRLSVRIKIKEHIKYFAHAIRQGITLSEWVKKALENQYKTDKQNKK